MNLSMYRPVSLGDLSSHRIRLVEPSPADVLKTVQEHLYKEWEEDFLETLQVKGHFFANIHPTLPIFKEEATLYL